MRRKLVPLALALSVSVAGLWIVRDHRDIQRSDRQAMSSATAYYDSLRAAANRNPALVVSDRDIVALGYLQRLRLGLSNPFRLAAFALDDPRLQREDRRRVAWALLDAVRRGDAYGIDPSVFGEDTARGRSLIALIDKEVQFAPDPRIGELAARLAFTMAAERGTVGPVDAMVALQVAALSRDRALSQRDVSVLLRSAARNGVGALKELVQDRASRRFAVERPSLAIIDPGGQERAIARAALLFRDLGALAPRGGAVSVITSLAPAVARRLAALALEQPPEAPLVVSARSDPTFAASPADESDALLVTNEEGLAAIARPSGMAPDSGRVRVSRSVLTCAVALRALAQQTPWFANDGQKTPSATDLMSRFGLRSVAFDPRVPADWRPFYRRELGGALADMRRVLPRMSTNGLAVFFGVDGLPDSALAMHDPSTRTLRLSIYTSGGTLAHELAHDLDWQAARRLYADGMGYSTDRAVRESRGTLGASVRDLAGRRLPALGAPGAAGASGVMRPAEIFARGADWLVASALAAAGRSNGFLSAVQDAELGGYAAGPPTIAGARPARSAVLALRNMTFVPDSIAAGLQRQWADPNSADPMLLVRKVLEAPMPWRSVWRVTRRTGSATDRALQWWSPHVSCSSRDLDDQAGLRLIIMAADARVRGVLTRRANAWSFSQRPTWAHGVAGDAPWRSELADDVVQVVRRSLVGEVVHGSDGVGLAPLIPDLFQHADYACDPRTD